LQAGGHRFESDSLHHRVRELEVYTRDGVWIGAGAVLPTMSGRCACAVALAGLGPGRGVVWQCESGSGASLGALGHLGGFLAGAVCAVVWGMLGWSVAVYG